MKKIFRILFIAIYIFVYVYSITISILPKSKYIIIDNNLGSQPIQYIDFIYPIEQVNDLYIERSPDLNSIENFVLEDYPGSRIDREYLTLLETYCNTDTLKVVIAISVAETGMGKAVPFRDSNFWGWFKDGNRNYDPDRNTMAREICDGISRKYSNIAYSKSAVSVYTSNDRADSWVRIFNYAMNQMTN